MSYDPIHKNPDLDYFFRLLAAGLHARAPIVDPAVTPCWQNIYQTAAKQGVCSLIWDGIRLMPQDKQPPREMRIRWALTAEKLEKRYAHQQAVASKLAALFTQNGLRMLILKGIGLSRNYPIPAHRECGDIDIYLFGESKRGDRLLLEAGARLIEEVPIHSKYCLDGVTIENHHTILNVSRNKATSELNALLVGLLEKEGTTDIGNNILVPPPTFDAIFINRHAAVHFPKDEVVLRHVCDWTLFMERHGSEIDHKVFDAALSDYRLDKFTALMTATAIRYLGAELPEPEYDRHTLDRFVQNLLNIREIPSGKIARICNKMVRPGRNSWRFKVLGTSMWKYYYDITRAQWNEKFTIFK